MKRYAFVLARLSHALRPLIRSILRVGAWSYVAAAIIQAIVVLVVVFGAIWETNPDRQNPVNRCAGLPAFLCGVWDISSGIPKMTNAWTVPSARKPLPLHEPIVINGINNGVFSLSKRNPASTFSHVSSLAGRFCLADEPACRSRIKQNSQ